MNGKDIFLGLKYVGDDLIEKAEYGEFPTKAEKTEKKVNTRKLTRRPVLVAAIIAMMLLLVGCTIVYVLSMREIKLGEQEVTYDVYDYNPENGEAVAYVGQDTMTQQVLTLAGLNNTPTSKAAREWYEFLEVYDPDLEIKRSIWGNIPDFGDEYYGYDIYTQEMKDKLDEILDKYGLTLRGKKIEFKTEKQMFKALGMDSVLNPGSEAVIDVEMASYYENGNFNLFFMYDLPGDAEDRIHSQGWLYYRNKDCFIPDTAVLTEAEWEEWNYTTSSGDEVLILRSEEAASAWFFSDLPNYTASLRMDIVKDVYEEKKNGVPVAKFNVMGKEQLERIADTFDFSLEPKLVDGWEDLDDGAVSIGQEINGYRIDVESAFTDGFAYHIVLRITAPEGVDIVDTEKNKRVDPSNGHWGRCEEDGDGLLNTCHYIIQERTASWNRPEDGSYVFPQGYVVPIYWQDMVLSIFNPETARETEELLTEGVWEFDIPLNDANYREIEFVTESITAQGSVGWKMDGTDVLEDLEIASIKLRTMGITVTCVDEEKNGDFFFFNGKSAHICMADGTQLSHNFFEYDPIDLDQVVYLQLADGTVLPVPGREEETQRLLSEVAEEPVETMPVFTDGVELLTIPITMKHLGGWATDATGDMDPLYEYFTVNSITIHPWGLCIYCPAAFDSPDSEAIVTMKDGREITLTGKNGAPYGPEPMNQLVTDITMDLSQVEKILLPDGTQLQMPTK